MIQLADFVKLLAAYVLAFPVGWEREKDDRSAGVRTFPLVAVASCTYVLIANGLSGESVARTAVGVMTGIGFIGAGAIMREGRAVHGTATAASIWNMGALGVAVGCGRYDLAMILGVINYLSLKVLSSYKGRL